MKERSNFQTSGWSNWGPTSGGTESRVPSGTQMCPKCVPKCVPEIGCININWELIRTRDFPVPLDLLNQNVHFNKIARDSNMQ